MRKGIAHLCLYGLLAAGFIACLIGVAHAQAPTNVVPANQAPISKTFTPKPEDQTAPGTGKFIILTREDLGKVNQWDFVAGAWECIPSRPNVPITKRIEFCHSSWDASPLLDCLVRDGSQDQYPRFVSLQVDTGDRNYSVNLYDINYRTWNTRCVWRGSRLRSFGVLNGNVFCRDEPKWFRLDATTATIRTDVPFIPLDVDGAYWLVRKIGETNGAWTYDPAKEDYVAHFSDVDAPGIGLRNAVLSPDGKSRAWILASLGEGWRGGTIEGTFLLQRAGHSQDIRVLVKLQARPGSGVPVIPIGTSLHFTPDGNAEFEAQEEKPGKNDRVWSIETASGATRDYTRPHAPSTEDNFTTFGGVPTPPYIRPYLKNLRHFGRSGIAPAFLLHQGILKKQPEYPDCVAGVSPDGRHILYLARQGSLAKSFIYGDLQTKQTQRWERPAAINARDSMEFLWVNTP
jgi:hypothetical protein